MENENKENIIDSITNNENLVEIEENVETTEENKDITTEKVEKPLETPEARLARLKRMVEQQEKKLGIKKDIKPSEISSGDISTKDIFALTKANIDEDDIQDIQDYAKFKKISIAEALKSSVIKNTLKEKQEKRDTANATNTGNARHSITKVSDEMILDKAKKGQEVDIEELVNAKWNQKLNRNKK